MQKQVIIRGRKVSLTILGVAASIPASSPFPRHGWSATVAARYSARLHRTVSAGKVLRRASIGR